MAPFCPVLPSALKPPAAALNTHVRIASTTACNDRPAADVQQEQPSNGSACAEPQSSAGIEQPVLKKRKTLVLPRLALPIPAGTGVAQHAHKQLGARPNLPFNSASAASIKQRTAAAAVTGCEQASEQLQQSQHAADYPPAAPGAATMTAVQLQQPAAVRRNRRLAVTGAAARPVAAKSMLAASRPAHAALPAAARTATQGNTASNPILPGLQPKQGPDEQAAVPDATATMGVMTSSQSACSNPAASGAAESMPAATFGAEPEQQLQAACTASLLEQAVPEVGPQLAAKLQVDDEKHQAVAAGHPAKLRSSNRRLQRLPAVLTSMLPTLKESCVANTLNAATLVGNLPDMQVPDLQPAPLMSKQAAHDVVVPLLPATHGRQANAEPDVDSDSKLLLELLHSPGEEQALSSRVLRSGHGPEPKCMLPAARVFEHAAPGEAATSGQPPSRTIEVLPLQRAAVRRPENTEDQPSAVPAWQFDLKAFDTHEFPMPTSMLQRLCSYA